MNLDRLRELIARAENDMANDTDNRRYCVVDNGTVLDMIAEIKQLIDPHQEEE